MFIGGPLTVITKIMLLFVIMVTTITRDQYNVEPQYMDFNNTTRTLCVVSLTHTFHDYVATRTVGIELTEIVKKFICHNC